MKNSDIRREHRQPSPRGEGAPQGRIEHWRYERAREQVTSPYFTHPSLIGLQGRFLASLEMTIRESLMPPSLLVTSHLRFLIPNP